MKVRYDNLKIKNWSYHYKTMIIPNNEIHDASYDELNDTIEDHISSCGVQLSMVGEKYINFDVYFAMKAWAMKIPEGVTLVGIVEMPNLINVNDDSILSFAEIACITNDTYEFIPIYCAQGLNVRTEEMDEDITNDIDNVKEDTSKSYFYFPETLMIKYNISQPIIKVNGE